MTFGARNIDRTPDVFTVKSMYWLEVMISDELYDAIEEMKWDYVNGRKSPRGRAATQWTHLQDAVEHGTISPMEAYDALGLGYVPEHLKVRDSKYAHLL